MALLVVTLGAFVIVLGLILFAVHRIRPQSLRFKASVTDGCRYRWKSRHRSAGHNGGTNDVVGAHGREHLAGEQVRLVLWARKVWASSHQAEREPQSGAVKHSNCERLALTSAPSLTLSTSLLVKPMLMCSRSCPAAGVNDAGRSCPSVHVCVGRRT